jgi:hypothetical protein
MKLSEKILNYFSKLTPKDYAIIILSALLACGILLQSCQIQSPEPNQVCRDIFNTATGHSSPATITESNYTPGILTSIECTLSEEAGVKDGFTQIKIGNQRFTVQNILPRTKNFTVTITDR